jgi:hypothetical protein
VAWPWSTWGIYWEYTWVWKWGEICYLIIAFPLEIAILGL